MNRMNVVAAGVMLSFAFCAASIAQDVDLNSAEYLQQFVGFYEDEYGATGEFKLNEENVLVAVDPAGEEIVLKPVEKDKFEVEGMEGLVLVAVRDESGKLTGLEATATDGTVMKLTKVEAKE